MTSKPVLEEKEVKFDPVSNAELDEAIKYARVSRPEVLYKRGKKKGQIKRKAYVGQELARDLLRIIGNTALKRRAEQPTAKLVMIAAYAARQAIPQYQGTVQEKQLRYVAHKCAAMKIMSIRRVWQMKMDALRKARGLAIPERLKQIQHPLDERPKFKNQRRLFS